MLCRKFCSVTDVLTAMVFGRKSAPVKPSPPTVEEILEDLAAARPEDPVYTLNPSVTRDIVEEDSESEVNQNFAKVLDYISKEKKLEKLREKVGKGFENLVSSQNELDQLTSEVQSQLENIKFARKRLEVKRTEHNLPTASEEDADHDLC